MKFEGAFSALATPLRGQQFDADAYRAFIAQQLEGGISGLVPIGTTGEAVTLNIKERADVIRTCVQSVNGRVPVIAGAGSNSTAETIDGVRVAREMGADAALVVTPYYNKPMQAHVVEHFRLVAKAHPGFKLVAYNVPSRTGFDLAAETCLRLLDIEEIVALKEATGSMARALDIRELCGDRLTLLSGDDFTIAPFISCGGTGVISVSSNVAPKLVSELVQRARAGDVAGALAIQLQLQPLHRALFIESNPVPLKYGLSLLGLGTDEVRPPLFSLTPPNKLLMKRALDGLGLLQ